ncbi:AfsR/SARP family transcriptional regulator [Tabrizicola sp.]|uniref:AfsR/SARP family transcriptional regulator n=1 Tax=Tabrizicola sp. TaxID=2005166 RepID=UPI003F2D45A3
MLIRLVGLFQVIGEAGRDRTPRGAKSRALLAMLCQTPGHRRPRRWLEQRLWSDRGPEQASGSLRQALTELRKALGPLALFLESDRDCVALHGFVTDLQSDPEAARQALRQGRDFLEGIDIHDRAFVEWLAEERQRVAADLGLGSTSLAVKPEIGQGPQFMLRLTSLPEGRESRVVRDLAAAIARLTAEYLLQDGAGAEWFEGQPSSALDLQVEGGRSADGAHLKVRLVSHSGQQTLWSQRMVASRTGHPEGVMGALPNVVFETAEAALM